MDALQKITEAQMDANGVCSAPNVLNGTVAQNKAVFDKMVRQLVAPAYNAAVDAIEEINATETGIQAEEALRVTAESGRVSAENGRVSAENERSSSEALRDSAENARISAETERSAAESGRVNAENGRAGAELGRVSAETGRAAAEAARAATESARVSAEAQRAAAESARNVWESFNAAKAYTAGNKVSYLGSSYVCIQAGAENLPTNTEFWTLIAAKGIDGEGAGDMLAATYDPTGKAQDIFAYADQKASGSAAAVQASLNAHTGRTDNPHGVTRGQIGAAAENHTHTAAQCGADPAGSAAAVLAQLADRAKIATGSYVGTGTYGPAYPNSITCPFQPKFVIVSKDADGRGLNLFYTGNSIVWSDSFGWVFGQKSAQVYQGTGPAYGVSIGLVLSGNTLSWNTPASSSINSPQPQCNISGAVYNYIVLG